MARQNIMKRGRKIGFVVTQKTKKKISNSRKGIIFSKTHINNLKKALVGRTWVCKKTIGKEHVHRWVIKHLGRPAKCENCGREDNRPRVMNWANIDHKYKRKLSDYKRLCPSCHRKYDYGLIKIKW